MPSPFAAAFDRHVWPALAERAQVCGTLIAVGLMEWSDATADLTRIGLSRGATYLDDGGRWHDRVIALLLDEIASAEAIGRHSVALVETSPSIFWRWVWRI